MWPLLLLTALAAPQEDAAMLKVLFLGDRGHHQPASRLAEVYGPLTRQGFAIDWEDDVRRLDLARLQDYDCIWMYANQAADRTVPEVFLQALTAYLDQGGGFFALHCTSGCYMDSPEWLALVGARFLSHGDGVFTQEVVAPEHPLIKDWEPLTCWDETYVQQHHAGPRSVLTTRDAEPWSWVRTQGKGRVYYNASGHDGRAWLEPAFLDLIVRGLDWCAGEEAAAKRKAWQPPQFTFQEEAWVPNYEGRDPHPKLQDPSTPEQALASLIVPAGFRAELFAAEPLVVNPVALAWDARGRCWVAESPDYPNRVLDPAVGNDRISILHDDDGDGTADRKTVFCEALNLPTGLLPLGEGLLVLQAPDLVLHQDADGDDACDVHTTLLTGFGRWDTHAGPSHLRFGPNNRIWGSIGYSGFTREDGSSFGSGLWSWAAPETEPRFEGQFTNNTWGLGFRADGEVFGSTANGAPVFHLGAPKPILALSAPEAAGAAPIFDTAAIHPSHAQIIQGDWFGAFTAAAGCAVGTGDRLPAGWTDDSLYICAPTGRLVARLQLEEDGSGFRTRDAFNLCSSLDAWFCPVQAEVGPDGAFWIADFSQFLVLHNLPGDPERGLPEVSYGEGNAHFNPLRDREHGRIFRIVPDRVGTPAPHFAGSQDPSPGAPTLEDTLVQALAHPHAFWRSTARRLLLQGPGFPNRWILGEAWKKATPLQMVEILRIVQHREEKRTPLRLGSALERGLQHPSPMVRQAALDALPIHQTSGELLHASRLFEDPHPRIQRHALMAAARLPKDPRLGVALAAYALRYDHQDPWLHQLLLAAASRHADSFLAGLTPMLPSPTDESLLEVLVNGSIEQTAPEDPEGPLGWRVRSYGGKATHTRIAEGGRGGGAFLRIHSTTGSDSSWCTDVEVQAASRYRFSGWIRTDGLTHPGGTHGALLNVHPQHWVTEFVQDTQDWTYVAVEFETGVEETRISLNCLYGGWGHSTGTADYDDLSLIRLGPSRNLQTLTAKVIRHASSSASEPPALPTADLHLDGDAQAGRTVFFEHPLVTCNRCHAFEGKGGGIGPDLTGVGARLDRYSLLQSIQDPNAVLSEDWQAPVSAMPALASFLTEQEIRDLVAFLAAAE